MIYIYYVNIMDLVSIVKRNFTDMSRRKYVLWLFFRVGKLIFKSV